MGKKKQKEKKKRGQEARGKKPTGSPHQPEPSKK